MYSPTGTTTPSRLADRARYDAETVHRILDEALICHVGFVAEDRPQVLPMLFVRVGSTVYLHASTGSHVARIAARKGGIPVAVEATIVDALVLARSAFHHSANYRAVVAHGTAERRAGPDPQRGGSRGLDGEDGTGAHGAGPCTERGRVAPDGGPGARLLEVSAKIRTGPPADDLEDLSLGHWAGLWPIREVRGNPEPSPDLAPGIGLPEHLRTEGGRS